MKGQTMSIRLLAMGDSIAADAARSFVSLVVEGTAQHTGKVVDAVNSSVDSSNVLDLLDRAQELLVDCQFDICIIFVGINDSKIFVHLDEPLLPIEFFETKLTSLSRRMEHDGIKVVLCGLPDLLFQHIEKTGVLDKYWYWRPDEYRKYNETIRNVAKKSAQYYYVDLRSAFDLAQAKGQKLFDDDGVHPNSAGHAVIAKAIIKLITSSSDILR